MTGEVVLEIRGLRAGVGGVEILKGIDLTVRLGEVHAIMGPNGSGKSTLVNILAGKPDYEILAGQVIYKGMDLLAMSPDERAREGVFLAFQYPVEVPGVRVREFLRTALDAIREHRGEEKLSVKEFNRLLQEKAREVGMGQDILRRNVNEGFSGGEKKRHEILQLLLLDPTLALLDETDSGLDIDALRVVAQGINRFRGPEKAVLLVTHYQRILNYVEPDHVHVLMDGRIVASGGRQLALEVEAKGYEWLRQAVES
ncbi:MAG: Fe-S cluster assembly ATPase SufC [Dehalococcoidia bacterium]|jgi:Fe-S cluster assembly ATP-binding protein|nr:Fe-S cluster assembly ATPase SufC [Dehalococcoidia bacterium]